MTDAFGFHKREAETLARRPSFSESLNEVLKAPKKAGNNGFLQKKSVSGLWNKRWFVIHGHYLTYYKTEPVTATEKASPVGVLNLWEIQGVTLDGSIITLERAAQEEEATEEKVPVKKFTLRATYKNLDRWRRMQTNRPKIIFKSANAKEAQAWLSIMRESPLKGSSLMGELKTDVQALVVKEVSFTFDSGKHEQVVFGETVASMIGDGATDMVLGTDEPGEISLKLSNNTVARAKFVPNMEDENGKLELKTPTHAITVTWHRKPKEQVTPLEILPLGAAGVVLFVLLVLIKAGVVLSLVIALVAEGALIGALQFYKTSKKAIIIENIRIEKLETDELKPVAITTASKKKGGAAAGAGRIGISTDPHITAEEAGMLDELRERLQDMWEVNKANAEAIMKKNEKFLKEFHADLNAMYDKAKLKIVMDKHINVNFRLVRFLRGRKHNVDKAEEFARLALLWRVALGSDTTCDETGLRAPDWLLQYFASPFVLANIQTADIRLNNLYKRDKEGHMMFFIRMGRQTSRKVFKKMANKVGYMAKHFLRALEFLRRDLEVLQEQTKGQVETTVTLIFDLEGFTIGEQVGISDLVAIARRLFPVIATQFVELLKRVLVFNAPWLFGTLWGAIKPFIPEEVQDKIQIHSGALVYAKHIDPYVSKENIPKYFGGTQVDAEDGNPFCTQSIVCYAPYAFKSEGIPEYLEGVDPVAEAW